MARMQVGSYIEILGLEFTDTWTLQGGNSGGAGGGGGCGPPTFGQQHFFRGFHTPLTSEVVLMGSFMSVMSDKTAIFQLKVSRIMTFFLNLLGDAPPTFEWKLPAALSVCVWCISE